MTTSHHPTRLLIARLAAALVLLFASHLARSAESRPLPFRQLNKEDYHCFVQNWPDAAGLWRVACLRSPAEWERVMHAAPVMWNKKLYAPPAAEYAREQLVIISRITGPEGRLPVTRVEQQDDVVVIHLESQPGAEASFTIKQWIGLWLPKATYRRIDVIDHQSTIASVALDAGQFDSVTPIPSTPTTP